MSTNEATPRNIRCYDDGGKTFDRYTVVFMDQPERDGLFNSLGMSAHPTHPMGFGQHSAAMPGRHLGKRIRFEQLPDECQRVVLRDLQA